MQNSDSQRVALRCIFLFTISSVLSLYSSMGGSAAAVQLTGTYRGGRIPRGGRGLLGVRADHSSVTLEIGIGVGAACGAVEQKQIFDEALSAVKAALLVEPLGDSDTVAVAAVLSSTVHI